MAPIKHFPLEVQSFCPRAPPHPEIPNTKLSSSAFNLTHSQQMSIEIFLSSKRTRLQWVCRLPSSRVASVSISFLMFFFLDSSYCFGDRGFSKHTKVTSVKIGMYKQNIHGSSYSLSFFFDEFAFFARFEALTTLSIRRKIFSCSCKR